MQVVLNELKASSPVTAELVTTKVNVTITCDSCFSSSLVEEQNDITSLPVLPDMQNSLNSVTISENLCGTNQWHCPLCGVLRDSTRDTEIKQTGDVFIAHLKRYSNNDGTVTKDTSVVSCIKNNRGELSIPFSLNDSVSLSNKYTLVATINHSGTLAKGGHYWAYIRKKSEWFMCNDSMVTKVKETVLNNGTSYILFYRRS